MTTAPVAIAPAVALNNTAADFTAACVYVTTHSPSEGRCSRCGARCRVARHEVMTPAGLALLGDRCAEIVLGGFRPWESKSGKGGVSAPEEEDDDTAALPFPVYPPKPRTMRSKYAGACSCGRPVAVGAEIVYADGGVEGCEGCDFGRGPALPVADDFLTQIDGMRAEMDRAIYGGRRGAASGGKALRARHDAALAHWIRLPSERQAELVAVRDAAKAKASK